MVVIVWEETLESKLRRKYHIPSSVKAEDIHRFIGKRMAERMIQQVKI